MFHVCAICVMDDRKNLLSFMIIFDEVLVDRIQNVLFVSDVIIYPLLMYKGVPLNAYHK